MTARQQFAFFGASNLALSRQAAIQAAARRSSGPLDLVFADGFGRSYVAESSVLGRVLPGIGACGALDALEGSAPLSAVVTDVGNDLAYGRTSAEVLDAVAGVLTRLAALKARVVVTGLPLAPLHATSPRAFRFFSRLFFPQRRIERAEVLSRAVETDRGLRNLAAEHGAAFVEPFPHWYGADPIHPRRGSLPEAWERYSAAIPGAPVPRERRLALSGELRGRLPAARRLWGIEQRTPQPCVRLAEGSSISLY